MTAAGLSDLEATPECKAAYFSNFNMADVMTLPTSSRADYQLLPLVKHYIESFAPGVLDESRAR
jgi:hypothetical protein